jgi:hypothetical protein
MTGKLLERSGSLIERRTSRRGLLSRFALAATAFSVAPVRYLTRPISAWAAIKPGDCGGRLCGDGYTEFCCTINHGKNVCPSYTFIGGWWKCTRYNGSRLCGEQNVRYYLDCSVKPGKDAPGGCHCANNSCSNRAINCNVFRYGQCNTQIPQTTPIACRLITCVNPASIPGLNCNDTYLTDNMTCGHDVPCLETSNSGILGPNPGA